MRISKNYRAHSINEPLIYYRYHKNNFSKLNSEMFFNEYKLWFEDKIKSNDKDFFQNVKYFEKKLNSLEIINLLTNKKKFLFVKKDINIS